MPRLFVYHPRPIRELDYGPLCADLAAHLKANTNQVWTGWDAQAWEYDRGSSFSTRDLRARFGINPGAVIFIRPVDKSAVAEFQRKTPTAPVGVADVYDAQGLIDAAEAARATHERGEPMLPRKLVVATLLTRWLLSHNYWGSGQSSHSMAYPNLLENSLPQRLRCLTFEVANDLKQFDLFVTKLKNRTTKWGLNAAPSVKGQIHALARSGEVTNTNLRKVLERDATQESAHLLIEAEKVSHFHVWSANQPRERCLTATAAIEKLDSLTGSGPHWCEIVFEGDISLVEENTQVDVIRQFVALYVRQ